MVTIADKINAMLAERGLLKRDLARALGVSPQTATDICKGRSAVTLRHLRNLVRLFELRADYWIDETRIEPDPADRTADVAAPAWPTWRHASKATRVGVRRMSDYTVRWIATNSIAINVYHRRGSAGCYVLSSSDAW